jgi:hypothetical protein
MKLMLKSSSSRLVTQCDMPQDLNWKPFICSYVEYFSLTYNHLYFMDVSALSYFLNGYTLTFTLNMAAALYG